MTDQQPSDAAFDLAEPLVAAWADQGETEAPARLLGDPATLADAVAKAHRKEQQRLIWVNLREFGAGLIVAGVFAGLASSAERPAAVWTAAAMFLAVVGFLAASSISHHWADRKWDTSIRNQMARRLAQLKHRAGLYRNVAWWYYLPLVLATALFLYGMTGEFRTYELIGTSVMLASSAVMYRFARRTGRLRYESEVERLESLLAEFDRGAMPSSTQSSDPTGNTPPRRP